MLLIVSGSQEITIDEIGEINDHIQDEAGHGANIIMGVGEDEALEDSIAVTIIATGFDIDQQAEISNTEVKKVIHALEDDQSMEQDLSRKNREPAIITPNIELEEKAETPIVKHTLDLEELDEMEKPLQPKQELNDLVTTTDNIKNMNVVYEEVLAPVNEEEFEITTATTQLEEVSNEALEDEDEQQITLSFDLPLSETKLESDNIENKGDDMVVHELDEDIKKLPVKDYIELITVTESNEEGEIRYALDDYIELESTMNKAVAEEPQVKEKVVEDEEIVFEKKVVESQVEEEVAEEIDPMNSPISELLKERAEERRRKMKDFNYKFNNAKIDDIEKIPAYKRQGVDLDDSKPSSESNRSSTSLSIDDNDDMQLRNNNSFLHDNVD